MAKEGWFYIEDLKKTFESITEHNLWKMIKNLNGFEDVY